MAAQTPVYPYPCSSAQRTFYCSTNPAEKTEKVRRKTSDEKKDEPLWKVSLRMRST